MTGIKAQLVLWHFAYAWFGVLALHTKAMIPTIQQLLYTIMKYRMHMRVVVEKRL
jgi:hypothetical protein